MSFPKLKQLHQSGAVASDVAKWNSTSGLWVAAAGISGELSPTALAGTTNNYNPTNFSTGNFQILRLSPGGANRDLTGLVPPTTTHNWLALIINLGANDIRLIHENASSTDVNRFLLADSGNMVLKEEGVAMLLYDITSTRWRAI